MPLRIQRRWSPLYAVLLLALVWIAYVAASIGAAPPDGAGSPEELAAEVRAAVTDGDAGALAPLLDYPDKERDDFAGRYVGDLRTRSRGPLRVDYVRAGNMLRISGTDDDARPFAFALRVTENDDGRALLSLLPPLP